MIGLFRRILRTNDIWRDLHKIMYALKDSELSVCIYVPKMYTNGICLVT